MSSPLIQALQDPSRYPHAVCSVELIETHISWVLLAGEYAYKIKKPVDFGFLDFSELSRRRHYCEEEIRLNRRTAPGLYLDVVTLSGSPECPGFEDGSDALEYAVRMRRFDPMQGFDRLLERDKLVAEYVESLGEALADLHEVAAKAPADSSWGSPDEVIGPMRDNFKDLHKLLPGDHRLARLDALAEWTEARFADLVEVIAERRQQGFVRECHGDVHLGNVALVDGKAMLFDCIEFSPDLRWTDVMADLAFVVMDLREHKADGHAWRLLDRYLAKTGDYEGLALLDFYVIYRAMVRAKVAALGLKGDSEGNARILSDIDRYLALAGRVAAEQRAAIVLACGVSGSGKSHLAKALLPDVGLIRLRSDVERKRLFGLGEFDSSGSAVGT
ncbi:MAG TPA: phosphotransferase, partial [Wenzhouxiangella sp.]|nr:phosphotransferase [Wenzhouxiangella sp.]